MTRMLSGIVFSVITFSVIAVPGGDEGNEKKHLKECGCVRDGKVLGRVHVEFSQYEMSSSSFCQSLKDWKPFDPLASSILTNL